MKYSEAASHIFRIWDKISEYKDEIPKELYFEVSRECALFAQELMETYNANVSQGI